VRLLAEILDHELRDQGQYGNYPALHAFVAMYQDGCPDRPRSAKAAETFLRDLQAGVDRRLNRRPADLPDWEDKYLSPPEKEAYHHLKKELPLKAGEEALKHIGSMGEKFPVVGSVVTAATIGHKQFEASKDQLREEAALRKYHTLVCRTTPQRPDVVANPNNRANTPLIYQAAIQIALKDKEAAAVLNAVFSSGKSKLNVPELARAKDDELKKKFPNYYEDKERLKSPDIRPGGDASKPTLQGRAPLQAAREQSQIVGAALNRCRDECRVIREQLQVLEAQRPSSFEDSRALEQKKQLLREQQLDRIRGYEAAVGGVTGMLKMAGGDAAKVGQVLDLTAHAALTIMKSIVSHTAGSLLCPMNIIGAVTDLIFGLAGLGGPDMNLIILQQLQEIRKELADFRQEVRLEFQLLRKELHEVGDRLLGRMEALEWTLMREFHEVKQGNRQIEYRGIVAEQELHANFQQALGRLTELYEKDFRTHLRSHEDRVRVLPQLNYTIDPRIRHDLEKEYSERMAVFAAGALDHAGNVNIAGGDTRVALVYGTGVPNLSSDYAGKLIKMAENPYSPWYLINDFVQLAEKGADTSMVVVGEGAEVGQSGELRLNRRQLANPIFWSMCVTPMTDLAAACPQHFRDPEHPYVRWLAQAYVRGEDVNDGLQRLTRDRDGRVNRRVFDRLTEMQLAAIKKFETTLLNSSEEVTKRLAGVNPYLGLANTTPVAGRVVSSGNLEIEPSTELVKEFNNGRGGERLKPGTLIIQGFPDEATRKQETAETLRLEKTLPTPVRLAAQLPASDQEPMGTIRFVYEKVDWDDVRWEYIGERGKRSFGKIYVIFRAEYKHNKRTEPVVIFRKRIKSSEEVHYANYGLKYEKYDPAKHAGAPIKYFRTKPKSTGIPGTEYEEEAYAELIAWSDNLPRPGAEEVVRRWPELKEALLSCRYAPTDPDYNQRGVEWITHQLDLLFLREVERIEQGAKDDVRRGLGEVGEAIRQLYGSQLLTQRFVELGLPTACDADPQLRDMLSGELAAMSWKLLAEELNAKRQLLIPAADKKTMTVPLAEVMRARVVALKSGLDRAISRQAASPEPFRHPLVEASLLRMVLVSRRVGIDLAGELKKMGVVPEEHWMVRTAPSIPVAAVPDGKEKQ
jgi:hypothetical protein